MINPSKVSEDGKLIRMLSIERIDFVFTLGAESLSSDKGKRTDCEKAEGDKDEAKEETKKSKDDEDYSEEMTCGICIDILYQAVTVMPCLHNVQFKSFTPSSSVDLAIPSG